MPIDYSKYPPNWLTEIRPNILMRDGNHCKHCGIANGQRYRVTQGKKVELFDPDHYMADWPRYWKTVVLTIAHLDHDITNNDYDNLAALCQRCHLKWDKDQHKRTRKESQGETPVECFCRLIHEELEKRGGAGSIRDVVSSIDHHYAHNDSAISTLKQYIKTGYSNINGLELFKVGRTVFIKKT